jgi:hypothetical protein
MDAKGSNMQRPGNFGDLSDTWFGELSGRGGRGRRRGRRRGMRRKARNARRSGRKVARRAKKKAFRAKARAAGWQKGNRRRHGQGRGPCANKRGWRKWRCRARNAGAAAQTMRPTFAKPAPAPGLLGLGFWGL